MLKNNKSLSILIIIFMIFLLGDVYRNSKIINGLDDIEYKLTKDLGDTKEKLKLLYLAFNKLCDESNDYEYFIFSYEKNDKSKYKIAECKQLGKNKYTNLRFFNPNIVLMI